jgi:hypothetical protein
MHSLAFAEGDQASLVVPVELLHRLLDHSNASP